MIMAMAHPNTLLDIRGLETLLQSLGLQVSIPPSTEDRFFPALSVADTY